MNFQTRIAIGVGVVVAAQLTTGCSTPEPVNPTAMIDQSPAPPNAVVNDEGDLIAFRTNSPGVAAGIDPGPPINPPRQPVITTRLASFPRSARPVSVFGELIGSPPTPDAGAPLDGGSNLAQVSFATEGACVDPDVDHTGTWLAFASTMHRKTSDIYIKAVNGKTQTQVTTDPADDVMPAFSPDGKTIAFASDRTGNWDIYTVSVDSGNTVQITNDTDQELHPGWSPDGKSLVYCKFGTQSARWEIWTVEVASPGVRHFLDYGVFPRWCPDPTHSKILFQRAKQRGSRDYSVWTIDLVNGQAMYPTEIVSAVNAALINPAWSPDGSRIVFVTVVDPQESTDDRPSQSDLWVVNIDGSQRTALTNGQFANFQPVWAGNGAVYFVSDRSGADNIWAVTTSRSRETSPGSAPTQTAGVTGADSSTPESHP